MPLDNNSQPQPSYPWINSYPKDLKWDADIADQTIPDLFDKAVKDNKDKKAIDFMGKTYTYAELGAMVDRFAKSLQDQGIGPGSKVGLSLPNVPFYPIAYYAILKTGATVANFNPLYGPEELKHQVEDSDIEMMVGMNLELLYPTVAGALGTNKLKKLVVCDMADVLPTTKAVGFRVLNALTDLTKNISLFDINKKIAALRDKNGVQPVAHIKKSSSILSFKDMLNSKGAVKHVDINSNDVAVLQYTGGTTGVPKAAMLTHNNITANTVQAGMWFANGGKKDVKALAILPFYHVFSMTVMMNLPLYLGGEIIMLPKFDPKETLKTITEKKPNIFAGVPTLYKVLSKEVTENPGKYDLSSLEVCVSGAAPLTPETASDFKKISGIDLLEGYGLSESSAAALANPVNGEKRAGSIGLPVPRTEIKIDQSVLTDDAKLKAALLEKSKLPGGETPINVDGEICLRGPQIMKGYWKRPDETAKVIDKDGWLHTGDIGRIDKDGYVSITGRLKEMIIVSGLKAFPRKIEEAILKNDAIDDVAVIGLPDERTGEKVKAYVVLKPGKTITDEELKAFLEPYLARYEMPKAIERRTSLPLTAIGKPDHKALRKEEEAKNAAASATTKKVNNGPKL